MPLLKWIVVIVLTVLPLSPFHGGNRGSNPLGDANQINGFVLGADCVRKKCEKLVGAIALSV